jgi:hypothetical protein
MAGAETWHGILNAIERLQAKALAGGREGALRRQLVIVAQRAQ